MWKLVAREAVCARCAATAGEVVKPAPRLRLMVLPVVGLAEKWTEADKGLSVTAQHGGSVLKAAAAGPFLLTLAPQLPEQVPVTEGDVCSETDRLPEALRSLVVAGEEWKLAATPEEFATW